jgi:hypothetical protein
LIAFVAVLAVCALTACDVMPFGTEPGRTCHVAAVDRVDTTATYIESDTTWFGDGTGDVRYHTIVRSGLWPAPVPRNETLWLLTTVHVQAPARDVVCAETARTP